MTDAPLETSRMEEASLSPAGPAPTPARGRLSALALWMAAPGLALFSPTFYKHAARRSTIEALGFLMLFGLLLSVVQTVGIVPGLYTAGTEISAAFASGDIPEVTITGGRAIVEGPQPAVLFDDPVETRQIFVIDTTGTYTEIDRERYIQGFLLTQDTLHILQNTGEYQEIPLSDINAAFEDPIVFDAATVQGYWAALSAIIGVTAFISLLLWHTVIRLLYLLLIALVFWGISELIRPGTGFGPVLSAGAYAVLPAWLLRAAIGFAFPSLFTIFFVPLWGLFLFFALMQPKPGDGFFETLLRERPLRPWRGLIAVPLFVVVMLNTAFQWNAWYVTLPLALLTLIALIGVSIGPLMKSDAQTSAPSPAL